MLWASCILPLFHVLTVLVDRQRHCLLASKHEVDTLQFYGHFGIIAEVSTFIADDVLKFA